MAYQEALNKLQIGIEAVYGDEGVDTIEPAGITNVRITPKVETRRIADKRGDTMPAWLNFVTKRWSEGVIEGYVDYERFSIFLDSMFGLDATTPHTYISQLDWTGADESSLSLRYGQPDAIYLVGGVLPTSLDIMYDSAEPVMFAYNFFGTDVSDGASFATVTVDTPDWAMSSTTSVYIDEGAGATMGTTLLADTAFTAKASITGNKSPLWHLGDLAPDSFKRGKWGGTMDIVLEATAATLSIFGDIIDATADQKVYNIRLSTTDGANTFELDFCGTLETAPNVVTDLDGVVTVELSLLPSYNTAYAGCWGADIIVA